MLDPVHDDLIVVDLEDDPIVAAASDSKALEWADERLAEPSGVLCQRTGDGCDDGGTHFLGKPLKRTGTLGSDPEVVHPAGSEQIVQCQKLPLGGLELRLAQ